MAFLAPHSHTAPIWHCFLSQRTRLFPLDKSFQLKFATLQNAKNGLKWPVGFRVPVNRRALT